MAHLRYEDEAEEALLGPASATDTARATSPSPSSSSSSSPLATVRSRGSRRRRICAVSIAAALLIAALCATAAVSLTRFRRDAAKGTSVRSVSLNISADGNVYAVAGIHLPHSSSQHNIHVGEVHCTVFYKDAALGRLDVPSVGDFGFRAAAAAASASVHAKLHQVDYDALSRLESDWHVQGADGTIKDVAVDCTARVTPTLFRIFVIPPWHEHMQPDTTLVAKKVRSLFGSTCRDKDHSSHRSAGNISIAGLPGHKAALNIKLKAMQLTLRNRGLVSLQVSLSPMRFAVYAPPASPYGAKHWQSFAEGPAVVPTDGRVLAVGIEKTTHFDLLGSGGHVDLVWRAGALHTTLLDTGALDQLAAYDPDTALSHFATSFGAVFSDVGGLAIHAEGPPTLATWWLSGYRTRFFHHGKTLAPAPAAPRAQFTSLALPYASAPTASPQHMTRVYVDVNDRQDARRYTLDAQNVYSYNANASYAGDVSLSAASISEAVFVANATWTYDGQSQDVYAQLTAGWKGSGCEMVSADAQRKAGLAMPPLRLRAALAGRYSGVVDEILLSIAGGATLYPSSHAMTLGDTEDAAAIFAMPTSTDLLIEGAQHASLNLVYTSTWDTAQVTGSASSSSGDFVVHMNGAGQYTDASPVAQMQNMAVTYARPSTSEKWTIVAVDSVNVWRGWVKPDPTYFVNATADGVVLYGVDGASRAQFTVVDSPPSQDHHDHNLQWGVDIDAPGQKLQGTGRLRFKEGEMWSMQFFMQGDGPLSYVAVQSSGTIQSHHHTSHEGYDDKTAVTVGPSSIIATFQEKTYVVMNLTSAYFADAQSSRNNYSEHSFVDQSSTQLRVPSFDVMLPGSGDAQTFAFLLNRTWVYTSTKSNPQIRIVESLTTTLNNADHTFVDAFLISDKSECDQCDTLDASWLSTLQQARCTSDVSPLRRVNVDYNVASQVTRDGPKLSSTDFATSIQVEIDDTLKAYRVTTGPIMTNKTTSRLQQRQTSQLSVPDAELHLPGLISAKLSMLGSLEQPQRGDGVPHNATPMDEYSLSWQGNLSANDTDVSNVLEVQSAGEASLAADGYYGPMRLLEYQSQMPTVLSVAGSQLLDIDDANVNFRTPDVYKVVLQKAAVGAWIFDSVDCTVDAQVQSNVTVYSSVVLDSGCNYDTTAIWTMTPPPGQRSDICVFDVVIHGGAMCAFDTAHAGATVFLPTDAVYVSNADLSYTENAASEAVVLFRTGPINMTVSPSFAAVNASVEDLVIYGVDDVSSLVAQTAVAWDRFHFQLESTVADQGNLQMVLGAWLSGSRRWTVGGTVAGTLGGLPALALTGTAYVGPSPRGGLRFEVKDAYLNTTGSAVAVADDRAEHQLHPILAELWCRSSVLEFAAACGRQQAAGGKSSALAAGAPLDRALLGLTHLHLDRTYFHEARTPFGKDIPAHYNTTFAAEGAQSDWFFDGTVQGHFWTATLASVTTVVLSVVDPDGKLAKSTSTLTQLPHDSWHVVATAHDFGAQHHIHLDTTGSYAEGDGSFIVSLGETKMTINTVGKDTETVLSFTTAEASGTWGGSGLGRDGSPSCVSVALTGADDDTCSLVQMDLEVDSAVVFRQPAVSAALHFVSIYDENDDSDKATEMLALNVTAVRAPETSLVDIHLLFREETWTEGEGVALGEVKTARVVQG